MINALSIDVEEHFQVHAFESLIDRRSWEEQTSRVEDNTRRILRLLGEHDTRATFFILGWVADRHPDLVAEIAAGGHEIAAHGYDHELVYRQTPDEFAADLQRSLEVITRAGGTDSVIGYRAPTFSITRESYWALDVLCDHGIRYDSSVFPIVAHDRYGVRDARRFAHLIRDDLWEFPVTTLRVAGSNWPIGGGGGYFRLMPLWLTRYGIRRAHAAGHPAVFYLHPWELDPEQPHIPRAPWLSRLRHYTNLAKTEARLKSLLDRFEFAPMREVFGRTMGIA